MAQIEILDKNTVGDLYYANLGTITQPDGTNWTTIYSDFDSASWENAMLIGNFNRSTVLENKNTTYYGNCDRGSTATADKKFNLNPEFYRSADDTQFFSQVTDSYREAIAGTPVASQSYTEVSGAWSYNNAFVLPYKNADGTKVTVTTLTAGTDGLLVADTDFFVWLNSNWETTITVIDSTTVTTEAQDLVFDLAYTPASAISNIEEAKNITIPQLMYKFESCAYKVDDTVNPRRRDIVYFSRVELNGELITNYIKEGETFAGAEIAFLWDSGCIKAHKQNQGATLNDV